MRRVDWIWLMALVAALGCATPAEMRKLQNRVSALEHGGGKATRGAAAVAELGAEIDELKRSGRRPLRPARRDGSPGQAGARRGEGCAQRGEPDARRRAERRAAEREHRAGAGDSQEVQAYRAAHTKWREKDFAGCVDLFGKFLQTYPASEYADDATYWLADCYFNQGNFSAAVLRFDDVARNFRRETRPRTRFIAKARPCCGWVTAPPRATRSRRSFAIIPTRRARPRRSDSSRCSAKAERVIGGQR
jgi:TolA-binding protein